jgi:acylphosphatase
LPSDDRATLGKEGPCHALAALAELALEQGALALLAGLAAAVSDEKARAEVLVRGRVQGVGFREFCRRAAEVRGVGGYAVNLADGRVRVVVQGDRASVESFVRELERGPRLARVEEAVVSWTAPSEAFTTFSIRHGGDDA